MEIFFYNAKFFQQCNYHIIEELMGHTWLKGKVTMPLLISASELLMATDTSYVSAIKELQYWNIKTHVMHAEILHTPNYSILYTHILNTGNT